MYSIGKSTEDQQAFSQRISFAALRELLTDAEIETICKQLGHIWRERRLPPATMIRSLVYRSLHRNKSIKTLLTDMAAANIQRKAPTDAAWCQARSRLPAALCGNLGTPYIFEIWVEIWGHHTYYSASLTTGSSQPPSEHI